MGKMIGYVEDCQAKIWFSGTIRSIYDAILYYAVPDRIGIEQIIAWMWQVPLNAVLKTAINL